MLVTQFPNLVRNVLHGDEHMVTLLLVVFSIGIGAGSLLCERLSGHKVELGLVPFGSIGLTVFGIDLGFATAVPGETLARPGGSRADRRFGGLYIVPLYALVQSRSDAAHRSRVIAANNVLNALLIVVAAGVSIALLRRRPYHPAAHPRHRADERRGGALHLRPGARIPDALHGLGPDPLRLPPAQGRDSSAFRTRAPRSWSATTSPTSTRW